MQGGSYHLVKDGISLFTYGDAQGRASAAGGRMPGAAQASNTNKPNQETGLKLHAASGKVSAQAQSGPLKITADQTVTVASITQSITLAAKQHVLLTAGGAYIKLQGGNIEIHGPGAMAFKASMRVLAGPASASVAGASLPKAGKLERYNEAFVVKNEETGQVLPHMRYRIEDQQGNTLSQGVTDAKGRTVRVYTSKAESIHLFILDN